MFHGFMAVSWTSLQRFTGVGADMPGHAPKGKGSTFLQDARPTPHATIVSTNQHWQTESKSRASKQGTTDEE